MRKLLVMLTEILVMVNVMDKDRCSVMESSGKRESEGRWMKVTE